jgi:hypothetical protein
MSISVGDFAENLLAQGTVQGQQLSQPSLQPNPSVYSANISAQAPDISNIEVPSNFIQNIVEEKVPELPTKVEEAKTPEVPQTISEVAELKTLIQEIKDLLIEVKGTLTEVTAAGGLGANMAGSDKEDNSKNAESMEDFLKKIRRKKKTGAR